MKSVCRNYCKGQVVIIFAISLIVLVAMVGLAIDSGRGYAVKAKLSAAVDAASIAAGRSLAVGATDADRIANANAAAVKFYNANFPDNYLGATRIAPTVNAEHKSDGYWQVDVSGSATMPTYLIRVLNPNNITVAASGQTIRRDLDMILVLDTSGSLGPPTSPATTPTKLRAAAVSFINKFHVDSDRVGFVSFASGSSNPSVLPTPADAVPINKTASRGFSKTAVTNAINALPVSGSTASAEAMRKALNEINAVPADVRSSLRVIVFFSDGAPNDVPATFPLTPSGSGSVTGDLYSETDPGAAPTRVWNYNLRDTYLNDYNIANLPSNGFNITGVGIPLYDSTLSGQRPLSGTPYTNTRCNVNKAARNMVEYVANKARENGIVVFSIGLGSALNNQEIDFCGYGLPENGANILKRIANTPDSTTFHSPPQPSGLYVYADNADELDSAFNAIASAILRLTR